MADFHADETGIAAHVGAQRLGALQEGFDDRGRVRGAIKGGIAGGFDCWAQIGLARHKIIAADHFHRMPPALQLLHSARSASAVSGRSTQ